MIVQSIALFVWRSIRWFAGFTLILGIPANTNAEHQFVSVVWGSSPTRATNPASERGALPAQTSSVGVDQAQSIVTYIPLLATPIQVSPLQFATTIDKNRPINPATTFSADTDILFVTTLIEGAQGLSYRIEWTFPPDANPSGLIDSDTLAAAEVPFAYRICPISPETRECTGDPLRAGTYDVKFFIDGILYQQAVATIR